MRVVFYTRSGQHGSGLALLGPLSEQLEVHLVLESSPEGAVGPMGRMPPQERRGVHAGDLSWIPPAIAASLGRLASVHYAVYDRERAFHPANALTGRALARLVRRIRPDVVHFDEASTRAVSALPFLRRVPLVLGIHDSHPRVGESWGRFELVRRRFLRRARVVLFHSDYARREFVARTPLPDGVRTCVAPLGIWDAWPSLCEEVDEEDRTVLFFGRVAPYKGIDVLRAAAPLVAAAVPGVRFVVAGRPVEGYRLDDLPPLPGGGAWEVLAAHVGPGDLCRLNRRAAVVVLPYLEASQSGVASAAFAFGKPVVASAVGGIPEVVQDGVTGRLVPPGDVRALAAALRALLEDAAERARLREGVLAARAGALGWPAVVGTHAEAYRAAAAGTRG
jgi:glycosyltransferase involved in cell wall biosynthesis